MADTSNKVLIIGAGLAGLGLAQVLNKYKVPFEIFERDAEIDSRKQGWAVALVECLPPLMKSLPEELAKNLPSNSVNIVTGEPDTIGFVNAVTLEQVGTIGGKPLGEKNSLLRVSREGLRAYFWYGAGMRVTTSKRFTHYTEDEHGVTAFFSDGTSAKGSVLVGADGSHSHLTSQLLGEENHKPVLSHMVPMFGEANIPPHIYEPIRKVGNAVVLAQAPGIHIQIGVMSMVPDRSSAHYFWAFMPRSEDPKKLSDWVLHATKEELHEHMLGIAAPLHPAIGDVLRYAGPDAVASQLRFLEFEPPDNMPTGRVSMLGDAAHSMIPFRGAGANTALLDACDLGELLAEAYKEGKDLASALPEYHRRMVPRGQDNVRTSHDAADMDVRAWAANFRKD